MVCRYLGQSGFWGTKQCKAGETLNIEQNHLKKYCISSNNYEKCSRYIQEKESQIPDTDYQDYTDEAIDNLKIEIAEKYDYSGRFKLLIVTIILLFFLVIYSILLHYNDEIAHQWWILVIGVIASIIGGYMMSIKL